MVIPEGEATETFFRKLTWKSSFRFQKEEDWTKLQSEVLDRGYAYMYSRRHFLGYASLMCDLSECLLARSRRGCMCLLFGMHYGPEKTQIK